MLRSVLAVILGFLLSIAVVTAVHFVGHTIYPPPEGLDMSNSEQVKEYMAIAPTGAIAFVLAAWFAGAFAGAALAACIARTRKFLHALIVGGLFAAACVYMLIVIPHPQWFLIGTIILVPTAVLAGWLTAACQCRRPATAA